MTPRNLPESVLHFQSFCFAYFLVSIVVVRALSSLVALSLKTILDRMICDYTDDLTENALRNRHPQVPIQSYKFN